jgi:hypothetical protein
MQRLSGLLLFLAAVVLLPGAALAQGGAGVAGTVRDTSGGALPGVTVEVTSPALIEKVRTAVTDDSGRYQITNLPIGTYTVRFTLSGFSVVQRQNIQLTSDFVAPVSVQLAVGNINETVEVVAEAPTVDVQSARTITTFTGEDLRELPTARNPSSLMNLVPGIQSTSAGFGNYGQNICSGGAGVWCTPHINNFNSHASALDADGLAQGRLMIDGVPINTGSSGQITGSIGGYVADVANAAEVSIQLSGALGESETGGTSINIIPRTGGNRFAGNYFTSYTQDKWFDRNVSAYHDGPAVGGGSPLQNAVIIHDHDVSGTFGGPILRDRLWFHMVGRVQGKEASQNGGPFYNNLNTGIWGANYQPDIAAGPVTYTNVWRNASARITYQASQKNKFNLYWDEQDSCQDPCDGTVAAWIAPEAWWSVVTRPNTLNQLTWNNPYTNRLLLEANVTSTRQHYDFTRHRYVDNPQHIPNIVETGNRSGGDWSDPLGPPINSSAQIFGAQSGSIYTGDLENSDNWRTRATASYVTGAHNAKIGYELQWYSRIDETRRNGPRLRLNYVTPATTCYNATTPELSTCGNTSLYYPEDPFNQARRPIPDTFNINTGDLRYDEKVWTNSVYVQDQWTVNRFTLNGALRYDNAQSKYGESCLHPDVWHNASYCVSPSDGVNYHNITPRWSVAWDVLGDGKTAVKWNMGKYLQAARIGGIYANQNPARRTINTLTYDWQDLNGNRRPDCDFSSPLEHTLPGGDTCEVTNVENFQRFGLDPFTLDELGANFNFFNSVNCGQQIVYPDQPIRSELVDYCNASGQQLLEGWDKRRSEWQFGLGIQRELLPRVSGEVTYSQRWYQNQEASDTLGNGCDLFQANTEQCLADVQNFISDQYDFYRFQAPVDDRLPNGGGYWVLGNVNRATVPGIVTTGTATTLSQYTYGFQAIDTNFIWRARGGLRINGGTSTGRSYRDTCDSIGNINTPQVRRNDYNEEYPSCRPYRPFQTNVRGTVSYTTPGIGIPVIGQVFGDWLVSTVFQSRPGVEISANYQLTSAVPIVWDENSAERAARGPAGTHTAAGSAAGCPANRPTGCLYPFTNATQTPTINLLDFSDMWGERITLWDLKLAKNIRIRGKRVNFGLDVYNLFNSDAIVDYNGTYNPNATGGNQWLEPDLLVAPRFTRIQVQFDF